MLGLLDLPDLFLSSQERQRRKIETERRKQERLTRAENWDPSRRWAPELTFRADTYDVHRLFKVLPTSNENPNYDNPSQGEISPDDNWLYRERTLPAGGELRTYSGKRTGTVMFDGPVNIPMIHGKRANGSWNPNPWMSYAPGEFFSLRPGVRYAKGHVIVAGLGMGYQLEQVCRRRGVERVTLIEKERGLVEWIFPRIDTHGKPIEVVVGDANKLLLELEADVALVDIYPGYGNNGRMLKYEMTRRNNIGHLWIWGSAQI